MEIEVKKLNALKKYTGSIEFGYVPPEDICIVPLCKVENVKVNGEYEIYEDGAVGVRLTVNYKLSGQCSYCLELSEKDVSFTTDILFVTEKDDESYYYDGNKIVLNSAVDDAILISQPNVLLCRQDCKGIDVT